MGRKASDFVQAGFVSFSAMFKSQVLRLVDFLACQDVQGLGHIFKDKSTKQFVLWTWPHQLVWWTRMQSRL